MISKKIPLETFIYLCHIEVTMGIKNNLLTIALAGIGALYSTNATSQDSTKIGAQKFLDYILKMNKIDTLYHKGPIKFEYDKSLIETEEIFALDINNDGINEGVVKINMKKKLSGRKNSVHQTSIYQIWIDSDGDSIFDEYHLMRRDFNSLGEKIYSDNFVSTDTSEINNLYSIPFFDGKPFKWFNGK